MESWIDVDKVNMPPRCDMGVSKVQVVGEGTEAYKELGDRETCQSSPEHLLVFCAVFVATVRVLAEISNGRVEGTSKAIEFKRRTYTINRPSSHSRADIS